MEEKGKLKSLSRLERARQSLASSLESIRSKVQVCVCVCACVCVCVCVHQLRVLVENE